jgi:glycerophosphoryl diester phosphodiesterase
MNGLIVPHHVLLFFVLVLGGLPGGGEDPGETVVEGRQDTSFAVAHRGLSRHAPENTMAAFRSSLQLRIGFELDVRRSADGHLVCIHDATVDRTTDGTGSIVDYEASELRALDAGSWFDPAFAEESVPEVSDVFSALLDGPEGPLVWVDLKETGDGVEEQIVSLAQRYSVLDRLVFIGRAIRSLEVRQRLQAVEARAQAARLVNHPSDLAPALEDATAGWLYVRFIPTEAQVDRARQADKRVLVAGPPVSGHHPEHWRSVVAAGVDGILTDYPLRLTSMLRKQSD